MEIIDIYLKSQSHKIISLDKSREMLSHAYLIECSDKFISDEFGMLVAQEVFCESDSICDNCTSCMKVKHSNMVDLKVYPKDKSIVVDDIVEIVSDSIQRPMDDENKVYLLKNFDEATTQAQNKILKTLEEPPQNVIFILTCTNRGAVLPTILSRVKSINEPLIDIATLAKFLEEKNIKDCLSVAKVSGGSIYSALKIAGSGDADKIVDLAFDVLLNLKSSADILKFSSRILALKKDFLYFVDTLIFIFRDASVISQKELISYKENINHVLKISEIYSNSAMVEITEKLSEIRNKLEFNCNLTGVVDQMLLDILEVRFLCQK